MYQTKDGYVRLHTNFPQFVFSSDLKKPTHLPLPSHKQGLLDILQCEPTKEAVAAALAEWSAEEFEAEVFRRHLCAAALRSYDVMDVTPQGIYQTNINPLYINKIGDAPKRVLTDPGDIQHALEGIRVLDLTRVLAGPVCGRTLAGNPSLFPSHPRELIYMRGASTRRRRPLRDVSKPAIAPAPRYRDVARQAHDAARPQRARRRREAP